MSAPDSATEVERALAQVSEIREHISRAELFRAYRATTLLGVSALALGGAAVQSALLPARGLESYLAYWLVIAGISVLFVTADLLRTRRRLGLRGSTVTAIAQFLPALGAGALTTWALFGSEAGALLPGIWAVLFGLGLAASRPFLAGRISWVVAWFLGAGALLLEASSRSAPQPWWMGAVFGGGCLFIAGVLWVEEQR